MQRTKCNEQNVRILGIADHKIVHHGSENDEVVHEEVDNYVLITTSAWHNSNNAAAGGVGVMIEKSLEIAVSEIVPWNERIIIVHLNGNPDYRSF